MIFREMLLKENKDGFIEKTGSKMNYDKDFYEITKQYIYSEEFDNDMKRLEQGDYFFDLPKCLLIKKSKSNRRRKVFVFEDHNKIILQYLNYMLIRKYDHVFSDDLYSARVRSRNLSLFYRLRRLDPDRKYYVVKSDIHRYSESIDAKALEKQLRSFCTDDQEFVDFIIWLITRNKYYLNGEIVEGYTSVMGGNPTAGFFYNVNLMDVDKLMADKGLLYCRYSDDVCLVCRTKEEAEANMALLTEELGKLNLEFNEDKSAILQPGEDLDLLGIKFANGYTDISDNTFSKVTNKFKHRANSLNRAVRKGKFTREQAAGIMSRIISSYLYGNEKMANENGHVHKWIDRFFPAITSAERLKLIDAVAEDCIRFVGTGRKTNAKYRITYTDIKKLGFTPLVYTYYRRYEADKANRAIEK